MRTVAALFVATAGCYFDLPGVDPWDEPRDARKYRGPHPVVAHPPCARWCRLAKFVQARYGHQAGDDGGCFEFALSAVQRWGGVIEHPAHSMAWRAHGIIHPPPGSGWVPAAKVGGWTCHVEQRHFGHRARKATWLFAAGVNLPTLPWSPGPPPTAWVGSCTRLADGSFSRRQGVERMAKRERIATPPAFRDLLISIARTARRPS